MKCETSPHISDEYDELLRSMFTTCDSAGLGLLSKRDFENLCVQMDLQHHVEALKHELFEHQGRGYLTYTEFRDGLVLFIVGQGQQDEAPVDHQEDLNNNSNSEEHFAFTESNENSEYTETPKRADKPKKYGRRSKPEKAMICMEEDSMKSVLPPSDIDVRPVTETPPPSSRYLTPSYTPVSMKMTQNTEVFTGDGDDDGWKKLDSAWNDYEEERVTRDSFDAEQELRNIWQAVVGDPNTAAMDKQQLCLLMESAGLPMDEGGGQLDDLFNILQKNDQGFVMFHNFAEDMLSLIYDNGNAATSTPNQKPPREENRFIDQEMKSPFIEHSTPIDSINRPQASFEKEKLASSVSTNSTLSTTNSDASVFVSDTSDLCPTVETVDPSAMAAMNRRRRKRTTRVSKPSSKGRNSKSNILPQHHPIKKRQLKNSPLSFLVNNDERYVSIETLRSHWEDAGLDNTSQILEALQIPEQETSMSIEVLTEAFDNEVNDHLSIKAIASLYKNGISYYKDRLENCLHCANNSANGTTDDKETSKLLDEKMVEMEELRNQLNSSHEELVFYKQENLKLKTKFEDFQEYENQKFQMEELNQQLEKSSEELKRCTQENEKLEHEIEIMKRTIKDTASSSATKVSDLQEELQVYKSESKNLMHQLVDSQRHVNKLQVTLELSYSALDNLQKESSHQRQRADELFQLYTAQHRKQETDLSKLMQKMRDCSSNVSLLNNSTSDKMQISAAE